MEQALNLSSNSHSLDHKEAIHTLVEEFRRAIQMKDRAGFLSLIDEGDVPWIGIYDDDTLARGAMLLPEHEKIWRDTPEGFIEKIVSHPSDIDERYWDLNINTDGKIASVHFQYSFHLNEVKKNWGEESWQLVHSNGQWKICSVVYSISCH